jgi:ribosomal protein L11
LGFGLGLLSLAAVIALIFLLFFGGQSQITSALVAALGSVGITVSAVGAAVQKAMSQAEKPLWDAEVGVAVVNAALITPDPGASARVGRTLLRSIDFHAAEQAVLGAAVDLLTHPGGAKA